MVLSKIKGLIYIKDISFFLFNIDQTEDQSVFNKWSKQVLLFVLDVSQTNRVIILSFASKKV